MISDCTEFFLTICYLSLLSFCLSFPTFLFLYVYNAGRNDRVVSGLHAVSHWGCGCRCHRWMAVLCSDWVWRCRQRISQTHLFQCITLYTARVYFLCRAPIAFDLLVVKRQWKGFITWSAIALLLLLVRVFKEHVKTN